MNRFVSNIVLVSGIVPATVLFFLSVWVVFSIVTDGFYDWQRFRLVVCLLSGIAGYAGLWSSLMFPGKYFKVHTVLLASGVAGGLSFIVLEGGGSMLEWLTDPGDFWEKVLWLWPLAVSLFFITLHVRRIVK